jgi:DNA-binding winged helix-turn-helix (wHTH) protein
MDDNLAFRFGEFEIHPRQQELRRRGRVVHIEPQVFDLLLYLVSNRERTVSKDELIEAIWQGRIISESALSSCISAARRALGDSGEQQQLIRTVSKRGFRFVGPVDRRRQIGCADAHRWRPVRVRAGPRAGNACAAR